MEFDYIVVGAGFAGSTIAERIATQMKKKVLVVEQRNHIGGNAYDEFDRHGVLVHKYGPHIFHTKLDHVWNYLCKFTEWTQYHHRVLGLVDGHLVPIPFNFKSLYSSFPKRISERIEEKLLERFSLNTKIPILKLIEERDEDLKILANFIYEKIFLNYTVKQWGVRPEDMDPTVTGRVPIYLSNDDRYFQDKYQAMPRYGFTKMFENMIYRENIYVLLNTNYKDIVKVDKDKGTLTVFDQPFHGKLIYTGPVDFFFDYKFGRLSYRSLKFEFENLSEDYYQSTGTVNYPNDYDFTRITEFKYLTGQRISSTTIVREYPQEFEPGRNLPYYPVKNRETKELYKRYLEESHRFSNVIFVGRLAEYQYYDMDAVTSKALKVFEDKIRES